MPTYASASDVTKRWAKTPTDEENELIEIRLADAERMIERGLKRRNLPDLATQIAAATIDVEDVKQIEAEAVLRLVRNPEGYQSESDGNYTYMLRSDLASGRLEILPEEWEILGVGQSSMFVIVPNLVMPT